MLSGRAPRPAATAGGARARGDLGGARDPAVGDGDTDTLTRTTGGGGGSARARGDLGGGDGDTDTLPAGGGGDGSGARATSTRALRQLAAPDSFALAHAVLLGDVKLDASAVRMADAVQILDSTIFVGNPLVNTETPPDERAQRIFDLSGVTTSPDDGRGLVTLRGSQAAHTYLKLTGMSLVNLAPAAYRVVRVAGGNDVGGPVAAALENYTSLLWLFEFDRSSGQGLADVILTNCTLLVPAVELQVYRLMLSGVTDLAQLGIKEEAQLLLQPAINAAVAAGAQLTGPDTPLNALATSPDTAPIPGDILMPKFSWFGLKGSEVTLTATPPPGFPASSVMPVAPSNSILATVPVALPSDTTTSSNNVQPATPPRPAAVVVPPRNNSTPLNPVKPPDGRLPDWAIAVIVVVSVLGAAALAVGGFFVWRWNNRKRQAEKDDAAARAAAYAVLSPTDEGAGLHKAGGGGIGRSAKGSKDAGFLPVGSSNLTAEIAAGVVAGMGGGGGLAWGGTSGDASSEGGGGTTAARSSGPPTTSVTGPNTSRLLNEIFEDEDCAGNTGAAFFSLAATSVTEGGRSGPDTRGKIRAQMQVMQQELGQEDSPWEVTGTLGKGGFGVVYSGVWRGLDVAIKRIIFQMLDGDDEAERQMALREAAINATLNHVNIVATYTYDVQPLAKDSRQAGGLTDWQMYIIQELCGAGSLFNAFSDRRFIDPSTGRPRPSAILSVAADIATGCAYIHSKSIIHGDLKPDNVLLKARGGSASSSSLALAAGVVAKVGDFGMSMNMRGNASHISGVRHGTPLYIAPEILRDGKASPAADVYSFGVIMWELAHGVSAWQHLRSLPAAQAQQQPVPRPRRLAAIDPEQFDYSDADLAVVPTEYVSLGRACLSMDPAQRPTFEELHAALAGMAVAARAAAEASGGSGIGALMMLAPGGAGESGRTQQQEEQQQEQGAQQQQQAQQAEQQQEKQQQGEEQEAGPQQQAEQQHGGRNSSRSSASAPGTAALPVPSMAATTASATTASSSSCAPVTGVAMPPLTHEASVGVGAPPTAGTTATATTLAGDADGRV
ncbi:hypothetical protein FOA52_002892 [Chlamydomonas sp. UWO 241]|nr:hypothetical protein FOA52_002892 [Chlamydomonas sp. UWO 241]